MSKTQTRALILSPIFLFLLLVGALAVKVSLMGQSTGSGKAAESITPNAAPAFQQGANVQVAEGGIAAVDLLEFFSDPDGDELVYDIVSVVRPSLSFISGESFSWIELKPIEEMLFLAPKRGNIGTYTVTIESFDKSNESVVGDINIVVLADTVSSGSTVGNTAGGKAAAESTAPGNSGRPDPGGGASSGNPIHIPFEIPALEKANPESHWVAIANRAGIVKRIAREHHDLADEYRDFYVRNPKHAEAGKARLHEALSLFKAWRLGDDSKRDRRIRAATEVRIDDSLPISLRARMAAVEDNSAVEMTPHKSHEARIKALAETARGLFVEFPTWSPGHESLLAMARISEREDALPLLARVRASKHVSEEIKAKAAEVEARFALVGRSLSSLVRPEDEEVLARLPANAAVLLYTWSAEIPISLEKALFLEQRLNPSGAFLGVCLDREGLDASRNAANAAGLPGVQLYDDSEGSLSSALKLDAPGTGYLIDGGGRIAAVSLLGETMARLGMGDFLK